MTTQPLPTGTRDVLADEMRDLRAIEARLLALFAERGYEEVATPTIEYQDSFARGAGPEGAATYRFLDESGSVLALRNDMTVPIARLVARRFAGQPGPFRLAYSGSIFRRVRPQRGQLRELRQIGVELIGVDAATGTAEVIELLVAALDAVGLDRAVVGLGDADLFPQLLAELGVDGGGRDRILDCLASHDLVAIEAEAGDLADLGEAERTTIVALSDLRGGPEVLERARALGGPAIERASAALSETLAAVEAAGLADRVQVDLGLLRDLGYYTGAILEVYDPAVGEAIGGGGRYDDLLGRFGSPRPAVGFALNLERLHVAQAAEQEAAGEGERR
jgi:ATP phosphoribosyltransferase regulatory subunit